MGIIRPVSSVLPLYLAACLALPASAAPRDTIQWSGGDEPPVHIGPESGAPANLIGKGAADLQLQAFAQALPEYKHQLISVNAPRLFRLLDQGAHVCSTVVPTPERLQRYYFTYSEFAAPFVIVTPSKTVARLPMKGGRLSLADLANDSRLKGLVVEGRSYGPALDAIIRSSPGQGVHSVVLSANESNLMAMLSSGRMDYTIEFPAVFKYFKLVDPRLADVVAVPFTESHGLVRAGVVCPRNRWGRTVIERLDKAIPQLVARADYRARLEFWLTDEERVRYQGDLADFYQFRSLPGRSNIGP
jgi:uncharacterized protein (TIGR02285 family)